MAPTLSRNHTAIAVLEGWPVFEFASGYCLVHAFPLLDLVCWSSCLEKKCYCHILNTDILYIPLCLIPLGTYQISYPAGPEGQLSPKWRPFRCHEGF